MELKKDEAKLIYESVPKSFKEKLEVEFGKETFKKIDFTDLETFDDLCRACGTTEAEFEEKWKNSPEHHKRYERMHILYKAMNQGWEMDTYDTTQEKWAPIFSVSSSGLDFSNSGCYFGSASAIVGFPLCYASKERSDHAGRKFSKLWIEFITGKPLKS